MPRPRLVCRSASVDDIAAWFLDTAYDGDAFFGRVVTVWRKGSKA